MTWQPIETLPEGQEALLYCCYDPYYCVGKFKWRIEEREELESDTPKRRIYRKVEDREREWSAENWSATHWMHLPPPPEKP